MVVPINKDRVEGTASQAATMTLIDVTPPQVVLPGIAVRPAQSASANNTGNTATLTITVTVDFSEYMDIGAPLPVITINDAGGLTQSSLVASNWTWQTVNSATFEVTVPAGFDGRNYQYTIGFFRDRSGNSNSSDVYTFR
jgi:hypothetical protein